MLDFGRFNFKLGKHFLSGLASPELEEFLALLFEGYGVEGTRLLHVCRKGVGGAHGRLHRMPAAA